MVLLEPAPTAFDLRWRMFGTPVRVHPLFWLMACFSGSWLLDLYGPLYLLVWVGCFFVSILVHEFGHIFTGRVFGNRGQIVLYGFGGLAIGSNDLPSRWKRIAVALGGPAAGFLLCGLAHLALVHGAPLVQDRSVGRWLDDEHYGALRFLYWMNLYWNLLNLVPIWPLDGGQVSRDVCTGVAPRKGLVISLVLSFGLAALLAVNAVMAINGRTLLPYIPAGGYITAILFGLLAFDNLTELQQAMAQRGRRWEDEDDPWRR